MAQHSLTIGNVDGPTLRAELNSLFEAIATKQSGAGEPSAPRSFMWWADTGNGLLKIRNANNNAWITVGTLAGANLGLAGLGANTFTGLQDFAGNVLQRPRLLDYGETVRTLGNQGGTVVIAPTFGQITTLTATGDITFTFNAVASGEAHAITLRLTNGGAHTVTWPTSVKWPGGVVPLLASGGDDWLTFLTVDGGTTWYGFATVLRVPIGFPLTSAPAETSFTSATTTLNVNVDAVQTGELLLAHITVNGTISGSGTVVSPPDGTWVELWQSTYGATNTDVDACFARKAPANAGATTAAFTTNQNVIASAQVHKVTRWFGDIANGIVVSGGISGTNSRPNSSSVSAPWGSAKNLAFAMTGYGDDEASVNSYPTGYTGGIVTHSGAGANQSASVASAWREVEAASENPGEFILSESEGWYARAVLIRPTVA